MIAWMMKSIRRLRIHRRIKACGPNRWGGNAAQAEKRERMFFGDSIVDWSKVGPNGEYPK